MTAVIYLFIIFTHKNAGRKQGPKRPRAAREQHTGRAGRPGETAEQRAIALNNKQSRNNKCEVADSPVQPARVPEAGHQHRDNKEGGPSNPNGSSGGNQRTDEPTGIGKGHQEPSPTRQAPLSPQPPPMPPPPPAPPVPPLGPLTWACWRETERS